MPLSYGPVTPESIANAKAAAARERAEVEALFTQQRLDDKRALLDLVDRYGIGVVKLWVENIDASLTPPSPGLVSDPRR